MVIKKIQYDSKKGWFVFEGEGRRYCISYETYLKLDLHQGDLLGEEITTLLQNEDRKNRAMDLGKNYALNQPRTIREVHDKLKREKLPEEAIQETLGWLTGRGYLNDRVYAEKYAREKSTFHLWSKRKIGLKLREKGLSPEDIRDALEKISEDGEKENLIKVLEKNYGKRDLKDPRDFQRVYQGMIRRGFSSSEVLSAMKKMAEEGL